MADVLKMQRPIAAWANETHAGVRTSVSAHQPASKTPLGQLSDVIGASPVLRTRAAIEASYQDAWKSRDSMPHGPDAETSVDPERVIQRKVGFEFETTNDWTFFGGQTKDQRRKITSTKKGLKEVGLNADLSSDNGHVEVVTHPLSKYGDVETTMDDIANNIAELESKGKYIFTDDENAKARLYTGFDFHKIVATGECFAKMQGSFGMQLQHAMNFAQSVLDLQAQPLGPNRKRKAWSDSDIAEPYDVIATQSMRFDLENAVTSGKRFVVELENHVDIPFADATDGIAGFAVVIFKQLYDALSFRAREDPKYAFPMMHRTDFVAMLNSLPVSGQTVLKHPDDRAMAAFASIVGNLDAPVFGGSYKQETATPYPTIREWLKSILSGTSAKDCMSPPPGYPAHTVNHAEGLGAMGLDNEGLSVFELRSLNEGAVLPVSEWKPRALTVTNFVGEATKNDELKKPKKSKKP